MPPPYAPHACTQDHTPDYDSYCMLGEAFMQIQEPEKAVHAFESALELNPKDVDLITRVGGWAGVAVRGSVRAAALGAAGPSPLQARPQGLCIFEDPAVSPVGLCCSAEQPRLASWLSLCPMCPPACLPAVRTRPGHQPRLRAGNHVLPQGEEAIAMGGARRGRSDGGSCTYAAARTCVLQVPTHGACVAAACLYL